MINRIFIERSHVFGNVNGLPAPVYAGAGMCCYAAYLSYVCLAQTSMLQSQSRTPRTHTTNDKYSKHATAGWTTTKKRNGFHAETRILSFSALVLLYRRNGSIAWNQTMRCPWNSVRSRNWIDSIFLCVDNSIDTLKYFGSPQNLLCIFMHSPTSTHTTHNTSRTLIHFDSFQKSTYWVTFVRIKRIHQATVCERRLQTTKRKQIKYSRSRRHNLCFVLTAKWRNDKRVWDTYIRSHSLTRNWHTISILKIECSTVGTANRQIHIAYATVCVCVFESSMPPPYGLCPCLCFENPNKQF